MTMTQAYFLVFGALTMDSQAKESNITLGNDGDKDDDQEMVYNHVLPTEDKPNDDERMVMIVTKRKVSLQCHLEQEEQQSIETGANAKQKLSTHMQLWLGYCTESRP